MDFSIWRLAMQLPLHVVFFLTVICFLVTVAVTELVDKRRRSRGLPTKDPRQFMKSIGYTDEDIDAMERGKYRPWDRGPTFTHPEYGE